MYDIRMNTRFTARAAGVNLHIIKSSVYFYIKNKY